MHENIEVKNNDSQNNTEKTNDGATRTPLKIENALVGVAGTVPDKIVLDLSILMFIFRQ
jgi:hypothetical protein